MNIANITRIYISVNISSSQKLHIWFASL